MVDCFTGGISKTGAKEDKNSKENTVKESSPYLNLSLLMVNLTGQKGSLPESASKVKQLHQLLMYNYYYEKGCTFGCYFPVGGADST